MTEEDDKYDLTSDELEYYDQFDPMECIDEAREDALAMAEGR